MKHNIFLSIVLPYRNFNIKSSFSLPFRAGVHPALMKIGVGVLPWLNILLFVFANPVKGEQKTDHNLGFRLGIVDVEGTIGTGIGLGGHLAFPEIARALQIETSLLFTYASYNEYYRRAPGGDLYWYKGSFTDISVNADLKYRFVLQRSRWSPYLGAGLGMHSIHYDYPEWWTADRSKLELGLNILVGIEYLTPSNMKIFTEVRGIVSGPDQLGLYGGLAFPLKGRSATKKR
ncbi:MAG: hypothetical protein AB1393_04370 [Candidatus Edwardsbacteria bacterium]